ncbi:MAG: family 10 glycosylhydrolase, partial [Muribaculaceae bacterium]|nr:family 10 glycosylhydrolase [Muribaculaceae bacterium]
MKKLFLVAAAIIAVLCAGTPLHAQPKREFRSTWMAGMGIDWPWSDDLRTEDTMKRRLQKYLDELDAQNFTSVCIHIRPRADAYYKSTLEPWSEDFTGVRGKDPGWDPLAFAIEECHKRGMECYAWFNPFRVNANSVDYQTDFDKEWREKGWLMKGVNGTWTIFNPGVEGARRHCLDVFKEVYMNYDIDGMLFDDYFYPGEGMPGAPNDDNNSGKDSDSDDYTTWEQSKTSLSLYDWRRENVNSFVRELFDEIQEERPDMRFGIGPAGVGHASAVERNLPLPKITSNDWQYAKIYA